MNIRHRLSLLSLAANRAAVRACATSMWLHLITGSRETVARAICLEISNSTNCICLGVMIITSQKGKSESSLTNSVKVV